MEKGGQVNRAYEVPEEYKVPAVLQNSSINEGELPLTSSKTTKEGWNPREVLGGLVEKHERVVNILGWVVLGLAYHAYFIWCIARHIDQNLPIFTCDQEVCGGWSDELKPPRPFWCDSLAFLIIVTGITWICILYGYVFKPLLGSTLNKAVVAPIGSGLHRLLKFKLANLIIYLIIMAAIATFLIIDTAGDRQRLVGAGGALVLIFIGWIFSVHPGHVRWRHIFWGHSIQFCFALITLRWTLGKQIVQCLSSKVTTFLNYTYSGAVFVFGYLANGQIFFDGAFRPDSNTTETMEIREILRDINEGGVVGAPFFFGPLSIIYFVSFFVSMLYYWGTLQFIVQKLGWLLFVTVGTTAAESMNAAANIFLGQTEAPLLIRPYLATMTKSEINAVMTGGFATIAGTVLGAFIAMGIDPGHLITCSFMAAPTALAVSKLFYPETEQSKTTFKDIKIEKGDESNVLDAAAKGASTAIMLVLNIAASLLAFYAFITFLNEAVNWFGVFAGWEELTFDFLLGYLLWPIAFLLGIPIEDCEEIGKLIGNKLLITEFPTFNQLGELFRNGMIKERSYVITTYALCGFANFPSIGIQIGGFGAMAPERKSDIAALAVRAMIGGCWVSFLNACIAGSLITIPEN